MSEMRSDAAMEMAGIAPMEVGASSVFFVLGTMGFLAMAFFLPRLSQVLARRALKRAGVPFVEAAIHRGRSFALVSAACALMFGISAGMAGLSMRGFVSSGIDAVGSLGPTMRLAALLCWMVLHTALLTGVLCDLLARVVPRETTWAMAVSGALWSGLTGGLGAVAVGVASGVCITALCLAVCRAGRAAKRALSIGGGDVSCLFALSLASGDRACLGCIICFAVAAAVSAFGCATGRMNGGTKLPLVPFFYPWFWIGTMGWSL